MLLTVAVTLTTLFTSVLLVVGQAEALKGQRIKITISDIVDRANGTSFFLPEWHEIVVKLPKYPSYSLNRTWP